MVFSFDVAMGIVLILFTVITTSVFLASKAERNYFTKTSIIENGRDIMKILEKKNIIQTVDSNEISKAINVLTQPDLSMYLKIEEYDLSFNLINGIEIGTEPNEEKFIASGSWFSTNHDSTKYYRTRYKIWSKTEELSSTH